MCDYWIIWSDLFSLKILHTCATWFELWSNMRNMISYTPHVMNNLLYKNFKYVFLLDVCIKTFSFQVTQHSYEITKLNNILWKIQLCYVHVFRRFYSSLLTLIITGMGLFDPVITLHLSTLFSLISDLTKNKITQKCTAAL